MAPRSRGIERALSAAVNLSRARPVCPSCRHTLARRSYASAATAAVAQTPIEAPHVSQLSPNEPQIAPVPQPKYLVKAGVLLSRAPLITPDPHPFEKAYYLYQRRLNERLVLPFTQYFYYKRGSPTFEHWRKHKAERLGTAARDIGKYSAWREDSWNDEVLVGDDTAEASNIIEKLVDEEGRGAEFAAESGLEQTAGLKRMTDADKNNDLRSLERSLQRTLYLLVKEKLPEGRNENWILPSGALTTKEGIAEAASRVLNDTCGVNMNTWQVARHPVGYYKLDYSVPEPEPAPASEAPSEAPSSIPTVHETADQIGEKTFFIKTRIFAGQANVAQPTQTYEDFAWLTKEEVEAKVHPRYWNRIKNMLVSQ